MSKSPRRQLREPLPAAATPPQKAPPTANPFQSKWDPRWCQALIEHCAQGFSYSTFGRAIGVTRATVRHWHEAYPEFQDARREAEDALQHHFELEAKRLADGGKGNVVAFIWRSKNVAKWRDHQLDELQPQPGAVTNNTTNVLVTDTKQAQLFLEFAKQHGIPLTVN